MATTLNFISGSITQTEGFDWANIMLAALGDGTLQESAGSGKTELNVLAADGSRAVFKGTFTVIDATHVTGPLTSFEVWKGSQQVMTASFSHSVSVESIGTVSGDPTLGDLIEALQVMYGDEPVTATGSAQTDQIFGGGANDTLNGGDGGDRLTGFGGADSFEGGDGWDDVRYNLETGTMNVIVNLSSSDKVVGSETVAGGHARDTFGATDSLHNIDFVSGTSHDDFFFGRDGEGKFGDYPDFVTGAGGDDTFTGGSGPLGVAYDQADIDSGPNGVIVNLSSGSKYGVAAGHALDTFGDTDTLIDINNVALSQKNDTAVGGNGSDHFWGRGGADLMFGNGGDDQFEGDDGKDAIDGGKGKDTLSGGLERDTLTGGKDADQFVYFSVFESEGKAGKRDFITDFKHGTDKIHLLAIDAKEGTDKNDKFKLDTEGSKSTDVAKGHIGWYQIDKAGHDNDRTILKLNVDNDHKIEMQIELHGLVDLAKGDFIL